ncbi:MAG: beta-ketoacyl-[acyl-carrier-protein] synthase II, partial [Sphaerochaetaceae bacterium]
LAVEAIATIMSIKDSFIHCTLNLEEADSECDLDYVPQQGISHTVDYALSESLGFGGHNGALVFGKYKG